MKIKINKLAHTRNASFTERGNIDAVASKFPSNDGRSAFMSIQRIQHCAHIPNMWYNTCFRINLNGLYDVKDSFYVDDIGRCSVSRMMMKKV